MRVIDTPLKPRDRDLKLHIVFSSLKGFYNIFIPKGSETLFNQLLKLILKNTNNIFIIPYRVIRLLGMERSTCTLADENYKEMPVLTYM